MNLDEVVGEIICPRKDTAGGVLRHRRRAGQSGEHKRRPRLPINYTHDPVVSEIAIFANNHFLVSLRPEKLPSRSREGVLSRFPHGCLSPARRSKTTPNRNGMMKGTRWDPGNETGTGVPRGGKSRRVRE
jgi:hypothetical protein